MGVLRLVCALLVGAGLAAGGYFVGQGGHKEAVVVSSEAPHPQTSERPQHRQTSKRQRERRVAPTTAPSPTPAPPAFVSCDANIRARAATTTCPFAEGVFYELYMATGGVTGD